MNSQKLVAAFIRDNPLDPEAWLGSRNLKIFGEATSQVFADMYTEAAWVAWVSATADIHDVMSKGIRARLDWGNWKPGDAVSARKLIGTKKLPGLQKLLNNRDVIIKGIEKTRYRDLGRILGNGVKQGLSMDSVAKQIRQHLDQYPVGSPESAVQQRVGGVESWSDMVARTETASAMTQTTIDTYNDAGIEQVVWVTAADGGCDICAGYADMGPVNINDGFGDVDGPPGHPNCLCVLQAVIESNEKAVDADLVKVAREAVAQALRKLDDIPMVDETHIAVPWPIKPRPKLDPDVWANSEIKAVAIANLFASQILLSKSQVAEYIRSQGNVEPGKRALPNVYDTNGTQIIVDGHHRLAALWLLGADVVNTWFLEE